MKIEALFTRSIHRPINGVVKADQLSASAVWQELDEFVVTQELLGHLDDLVHVLLTAVQSPRASSGNNGVWVSGFFGCGKSHLIKVLAYLLENQVHHHDGAERLAVRFFEDKLPDPLLFADLRRAVDTPTDTILFNIDSKADHAKGRDALLQVFLRVLNEKQGYSGDHAHIAHMERHLDERGLLHTFHAAFEREAGSPWLQQRDAWLFFRDQVQLALSEALGQSAASVEAWVEGSEDSFSLTVENFAGWVRRYLDRQGPEHRLVFLVDEVGQFIGSDTHLMLNLQTITEQLGTVCDGRAWVVVTSQEDLDAVLGDLKRTKQHDFSKIQGRFRTRLSLSSKNVDEVIKRRLLDKNPDALGPLQAAYEGKHDILRNQLSFVNAGRSFKTYTDSQDFAACYPFAAYQFSLVQQVFESIRKAGATGLHLSHGERSTLDAFQGAARSLGGEPIGALVPFHGFYPAVEGFLESAVRRTIDQARDNHALQPFDATLLEILFLIRYIEELPGSVDNLVTLCVDCIDADRLALRKRIEASLARLESETLIARNGDLYLFLTNEERDIGREIKNTPVESGAEERELGKLLFEDLLKDRRRHTYAATGRDFPFTRLCDDHPLGARLEGQVEVAFASPLADNYAELAVDARCILLTSLESGRVLIRLPDHADLGRELRVWLQTETYVRTKHTGTLPDTTKRILRDRSEDNRGRRDRIVEMLAELLGRAAFFASGTRLSISASKPLDALGEALEYLIANAYPKMTWLEHLHPNPKVELQSLLRANDLDRSSLGLQTTAVNTRALDDLREYVGLCARTSKQIVLHELVEKRYGQRPYGWPVGEVLLLVARLAVLKELSLVVNAAPLPLAQAYEHLVSPARQRRVVLVERQVAGKALIAVCQQVGKDLFGQLGPASEDALFEFLQERLASWQGELSGFQSLAETGDYPGREEIVQALQLLRPLVGESDSLRFLKRVQASRDELRDLGDDHQDLVGFYTHQRPAWESLRQAVRSLGQNRSSTGAPKRTSPMASARSSARASC